jgi:hypothetical protein
MGPVVSMTLETEKWTKQKYALRSGGREYEVIAS